MIKKYQSNEKEESGVSKEINNKKSQLGQILLCRANKDIDFELLIRRSLNLRSKIVLMRCGALNPLGGHCKEIIR